MAPKSFVGIETSLIKPEPLAWSDDYGNTLHFLLKLGPCFLFYFGDVCDFEAACVSLQDASESVCACTHVHVFLLAVLGV